MPLWPSELIADPSLGAALVAGDAGLDRRGPIRWAHISELPDPTPWLEGGELLLTTGLGVRDDVDLQRRFIAGVAERGVVAVGISMGVSLDVMPEAMVETCDAHDLPLFTMPYEIPFIAVSRRVAHHSFEERYATLRQAVELHRRVLATVGTGGGVGSVTATVARALPGVALIVQDFGGGELGRSDPTGLAADLPASRLWSSLPPSRTRGRCTVGDREVVRVPVLVGGELEASVIAVSAQPMLEAEELLFEQGVAGISLELARERSVRDARRGRIDELWEEIARGRSTSGLIEQVLTRLGADRPSPFRLLAMRRPDPSPRSGPLALCALVEDVLLPDGPPIVGHLDGVVYALIGDDPEVAQRIHAASVRRGWPELTIGRSRAKQHLDAARAAMREASVALQLDGTAPIRDIDSLGLTGLLAGMRDDLGAADFVAQVLGPVLDHDRRESAQLADTLRAYLASGCRPGPAAEQLEVHRHTLAYRLERIRDLTGRDPRSGEHLVAYGLALELLGRWEP